MAAVAACLARPDRVEESYDDNRQMALFGIGESKKFIDRLGVGVAPAADACCPQDTVI